jgi:hypothetical protein
VRFPARREVLPMPFSFTRLGAVGEGLHLDNRADRADSTVQLPRPLRIDVVTSVIESGIAKPPEITRLDPGHWTVTLKICAASSVSSSEFSRSLGNFFFFSQ